MTTETADPAGPVVDQRPVYLEDVEQAFRRLSYRAPDPMDMPTAEEAEALLGMLSGRLLFVYRVPGWIVTGRQRSQSGVRARELDHVLAMVLHAHDWISLEGITQAGRDAANRFTGQPSAELRSRSPLRPSLRQIADHIAGRTAPW